MAFLKKAVSNALSALLLVVAVLHWANAASAAIVSVSLLGSGENKPLGELIFPPQSDTWVPPVNPLFPGNISELRPIRVRPSLPAELRDNPQVVQYFPLYEAPPAAPSQSSIELTAGEMLTVVFPYSSGSTSTSFSSSTSTYNVSFDGEQIFIDTFRPFQGDSLVVGATVQLQSERLLPIGSLAAGTYTLHFRSHYAPGTIFIGGSPDFIDPNDPYFETTHTFTVQPLLAVVPEPSSLALCSLFAIACLAARRRGKGKRTRLTGE